MTLVKIGIAKKIEGDENMYEDNFGKLKVSNCSIPLPHMLLLTLNLQSEQTQIRQLCTLTYQRLQLPLSFHIIEDDYEDVKLANLCKRRVAALVRVAALLMAI